MSKKNNKCDERVLKKLIEDILDLRRGVKEYKISQPQDLSNIYPLLRKGMIRAVSCIFELTKELSESAFDNLNLDKDMVKAFRNSASHNYSSINNVVAFSCIEYCTRQSTVLEVDKVLKEIQSNQD